MFAGGWGAMKQLELGIVPLIVSVSLAELASKVLIAVIDWHPGDYDLFRYFVSPLSVLLVAMHAPIWVSYIMVVYLVEHYVKPPVLAFALRMSMFAVWAAFYLWLCGWQNLGWNFLVGILAFLALLLYIALFAKPRRIKPFD